MNRKYSKDDYVRYASAGICLVFDIIMMDAPKEHKKKKYYVLKPVSDKAATLFLPYDSEVVAEKLSRAPGKSDVDELIISSKNESILWLEDKKDRRELFDAIIGRCDEKEFLQLIRCISAHKLSLEKEGKKLASSDETALKTAKKAISDEFSFVLGISPAQVMQMLGVENADNIVTVN